MIVTESSKFGWEVRLHESCLIDFLCQLLKIEHRELFANLKVPTMNAAKANPTMMNSVHSLTAVIAIVVTSNELWAKHDRGRTESDNNNLRCLLICCILLDLDDVCNGVWYAFCTCASFPFFLFL